MPSIHDDILGEVVVRRSKAANSIRIKYGVNGKYIATLPLMTPMFYLKRVLKSSRDDLLKLAESVLTEIYHDKQSVGRSHTIGVVYSGLVNTPTVKTVRSTIVMTVPHGSDPSQKSIQDMIREEVKKVLRQQAKVYLTERLHMLAQQGNFSYQRVRFSHAGGRWGSCSTNGTISLNIALMKLPEQLIDYVLVHELAHTREMNHSSRFWNIVGAFDPLYKLHRRQIKQHTPHL